MTQKTDKSGSTKTSGAGNASPVAAISRRHKTSIYTIRPVPGVPSGTAARAHRARLQHSSRRVRPRRRDDSTRRRRGAHSAPPPRRPVVGRACASGRRQPAARPRSADRAAASTRSGRERRARSTRRLAKCSRLVRPPPGMLPAHSARAPVSSGTALDVDRQRAAARDSHLRRMPDQAEAGDVGARVHGPGGSVRAPRRRRGSGASIDCTRRRRPRRRRPIELQRRRDDPGAERLREKQHIARPAPAIRPDPRRMDLARDGIAELDLLVLDRVAAEQRDARFAELVETAGERSGRAPPRSASFGKAAIASAVSGRPPIA